jgi:16S rRNA (guanine(966)-N(2))-methyltransferase RsmD
MKSPRGNVRPTTGKVLGALFNILGASGNIIGASFLDLFSGTGEVALEALRRGASRVVAVESSKIQAGLIRSRLCAVNGKPTRESDAANEGNLGNQSRAKCLCRDARRAIPLLAGEGTVFDVIFADPPYGMGWGESLPPLIARHAALLASGGLFVLERSVRDGVADPDGIGEGKIFSARDDRIYGDTVLSIYRKIMTEE